VCPPDATSIEPADAQDPTAQAGLRAQLERYATELRGALASSRTSRDALDPALAQLRVCAEDLHGLQQRSTQAVSLLEQSLISTLSWLVDAVDRRDTESRGHSRRVDAYTRVLANSLGLGAAETERIATAGRLHDAGRVEWPDTLLLKRGPPSAEERAAIQMHCQLADGLSGTPSELLTTIAQVIANHHEHWDGSGYPHGVAGEAIPLAARIVVLADVYDTLRTAYRYKLTQSHQAACRAILQGDGRVSPAHFDPYVIDAFGRAAAQLASPELDVG
jgi:putative two-component system response regulator